MSIRTGYGDGHYPVYAEYADTFLGKRIARVTIEFLPHPQEDLVRETFGVKRRPEGPPDAAAAVGSVLAALLGDYLERSQDNTSMVQRIYRLMVKIVKGFPRA